MRLTPAFFISSVALISGLTACPSTSDPTDDATVGAEMGSTDTDTSTDTGGETSVSVTGLSLMHQPDDPQTASSVTATLGTDGVEVVHSDSWQNCCFMPFASATVVDLSINVSYMDNGEECDCECAWTVSYTLEGVPPGDWTIRMPDGATAEVTVE